MENQPRNTPATKDKIHRRMPKHTSRPMLATIYSYQRIDRSFLKGKETLWRIYIDGKCVHNHIKDESSKMIVEDYGIFHTDYAQFQRGEGNFFRQSLRFVWLRANPLISHSNDKYDWSQLDNVGEIRVEVYYGQTISPKETAPDSAIRLVSSKQRFNPDFKLIGVPKEEFENDSKSLQVEQVLKQDGPDNRLFHPYDNPCAVFSFYYRTREDLKKLGVIAETPTPGPDMESAKSGEKGMNQYIEQEKPEFVRQRTVEDFDPDATESEIEDVPVEGKRRTVYDVNQDDEGSVRLMRRKVKRFKT
ncbi:hypothetical protein BS50DRAFT_632590 [Corynespora cassiicola Philippines]|uniref:DUF7918 domain-containing protein n=1 Tax=Corynespora cassiicola Philippines TaxID=1448308 RepID=A0A2T2NTG6_CORCC|nr:hypothetical protein BS50DRAFT_632590 [Corynespora cassiicola Philippines]